MLHWTGLVWEVTNLIDPPSLSEQTMQIGHEIIPKFYDGMESFIFVKIECFGIMH